MSEVVINRTFKHNISDFAQSALGNCMLAFPFLNNIFRYKNDSLRIVYYHVVSNSRNEYYFENKTISPVVFEDHLNFLSRRFDIISLSEAFQIAETKESLRRKLVLTFDDGFAENYTVIAPILQKKRLRATFFLIGNCIDNKDLMWRNKLLVITRKSKKPIAELATTAAATFNLPAIGRYEDILRWSFRTWPMDKKESIANFMWDMAGIGPLKEYMQVKQPYLSCGQIRTLINEGFEIGSHSMSHPVFSRLTYSEFEMEIRNSVQSLETSFNQEITSFSYPFGLKACPRFEQQLLEKYTPGIKTFLGTRNRLNNYSNCLQWQRDNLEFPMNKMLFRLNILPLLRRFSQSL